MKSTELDLPESVRNVVSEGCTWSVYEQSTPHGPRQRTLIFMSERIARRVKGYPRNWFDLSDEALAELSKGV